MKVTNNMSSDFTAEWGLSPKLEGMDRGHFGLHNHFDKDLDVTDTKVLEYIGSIEAALQEYGVDVNGTVQVYESDETTERGFDEILEENARDWTPGQTINGMPHKDEAYFNMLGASVEALHAIQDYEGQEVDEDFEIYGLDFNSYDELLDEMTDSERHILGATVEYETELGDIEFSFHSPNIHLEDHDNDADRRRRDSMERLRDTYPFGIDVYGDEELRDIVNQASEDFNDKWTDQFRNQAYSFFS